MPDFNVRSDSVNVEQIMEQIRERIREKRGVDYTEQQIRELADVKLERFLDPRGVRSDLLDQFRKAQPAYEPPELPNFAFEDATLFESHRAPIRWIRKLLMPLLKLFFNPNPLIQALHIQSRLNAMNAEREAKRESARRAMDQLYYELVHNLVVETTRTGIEVKNLKMRIESIASRLEFNERRARALESAVVYRTESDDAPAPRQPQSSAPPRQQPSSHQPQGRSTPPTITTAAPASVVPMSPPAVTPPTTTQGQPASGQQQQQSSGVPGEGPGQRSRRRRRRRGRRGGGAASVVMGAPGSPAPETVNANGSTEAADNADALDGIDDEGSLDVEEMDEPAAERETPAAAADVPTEDIAAPQLRQTVESPVEHVHAEHATSAAPEAAQPASTEPVATTSPATHEPSATVAPPATAVTQASSAAPVIPAPSTTPAAPAAHAEPVSPPPAPDHADRDPQ
jgi:hypothetical protein